VEFNEQQLKAIDCGPLHTLILAGAGTGKTRTIIGRAAHLVRQGGDPKKLAIITFTRRAANEIRQRLVASVGNACDNIVSGTFHHFCLREMTSRPDWFGLTGSTIMDRDDQSQLMKLARGAIIGKRKVAGVPQASQLVSTYSYARNTNQPIRDYLEKYSSETESTISIILQIFAAYKKRKQQSGYLDFDDILHRFAKVLRDEPDICKRIAGQFEHVLVDEMQDTNPLQWLILEALAPYAQLFCVGDDAQSIYAFRGADFRNVHSFSQRLPESQTLKLELNYRSTQEILDLSNWLLSQSPLKYGKKLSAHRGQGLKPTWVEFDSEQDEAEWVVERIMARHQNDMRWDEQMVLCRTSHHARNIETELIKHKVPYRFIGGIGLLQMAHVKDLLAVLRIAVSHQDELAWIRYLMMWPGIGEVTAAMLIEQMRQSTDSKSAIVQLAKLRPKNPMLRPLRSAVKSLLKPARCIKEVAELLDDVMMIRYDNWQLRRRDFELLVRLAERQPSIKEFLDAYTLDPITSSEAETEQEEDILTLITVHSAKGTESKVCHVVAVQPGSYPHFRSSGNTEAIEEERRILYVAMTRAKDELVISYNHSFARSPSNWRAQQTPVNFLKALPKDLVDSRQHRTPARFQTRSSSYWEDDLIE
jgi:DNA helicase II / ATP-dependent DNA helicase PcrA